MSFFMGIFGWYNFWVETYIQTENEMEYTFHPIGGLTMKISVYRHLITLTLGLSFRCVALRFSVCICDLVIIYKVFIPKQIWNYAYYFQITHEWSNMSLVLPKFLIIFAKKTVRNLFETKPKRKKMCVNQFYMKFRMCFWSNELKAQCLLWHNSLEFYFISKLKYGLYWVSK